MVGEWGGAVFSEFLGLFSGILRIGVGVAPQLRTLDESAWAWAHANRGGTVYYLAASMFLRDANYSARRSSARFNAIP